MLPVKKILPLIILSFFAGCAHGPQGYRSDQAPHITIVKYSELENLEVESKPFSLNFGNKVDGTQIVKEYLKKAQEAGGIYLTDLAVSLYNPKDKQPEICTTRVMPEGETIRTATPHYTPGQTRSKYVMKPVSRMVTEYEYKCKSVQKSYTAYETKYESQYDYSSKSYRSVPRSQAVTRYKTEQECRSEPITRYVTRYEYQYENEYIPAKWETISTYHTQWKLVESDPECSSAEIPTDLQNPHLVSGTIYWKKGAQPSQK